MSKIKTRVVPAVLGVAQLTYTGNLNDWLAQYYDADKGLWFDIGDVKPFKADAEANEKEYRERQEAIDSLTWLIGQANKAADPDDGNSDDEIENLRAALSVALTRWPEISTDD
jgi:hypothetical protein